MNELDQLTALCVKLGAEPGAAATMAASAGVVTPQTFTWNNGRFIGD